MEIVLGLFTVAGGIIAIVQIPAVSSVASRWSSRLKIKVSGQIDDPCIAATTATLRLIASRPHRVTNTIRPIQTSSELRSLYSIDASAYGETDIGYELFEKWWLAHRTGLYGLFDGSGEVLGAIGIWPVDQHFYQSLCVGRVGERDLTSELIARSSAVQCSYWYISGLVVKSEHRNRVGDLLLRTILHWHVDHDIGYPVNFVAIGYSSRGEDVLARFNFKLEATENSAKDGHPVYSQTLSRRDLKRVVSALEGPL